MSKQKENASAEVICILEEFTERDHISTEEYATAKTTTAHASKADTLRAQINSEWKI